MRKIYSLKVMGLVLFSSLDKHILLLFLFGQTLALIASPLSLEFTAMLCKPSLNTHMATKISSQELEMKVWQLFNKGLCSMMSVVTQMVIRLWKHEFVATPIWGKAWQKTAFFEFCCNNLMSTAATVWNIWSPVKIFYYSSKIGSTKQNKDENRIQGKQFCHIKCSLVMNLPLLSCHQKGSTLTTGPHVFHSRNAHRKCPTPIYYNEGSNPQQCIKSHSSLHATFPSTLKRQDHLGNVLWLVQDHTLILDLEPFHGIFLGDTMLNTNPRFSPASSAHSVTWALKHNIEVHSIYARGRVIPAMTKCCTFTSHE